MFKGKGNFLYNSSLQISSMILLTLLTQVILLVKSSITAEWFGTSIQMDAYNFVNNLGTFIFSFIGAGVTTILIPSYLNNKNSKAINTFITGLYSILCIILVLIFNLRLYILSIASNGNEQFVVIASGILFVVLFTHFVNSITSVTNAMFQCRNKYNFPKLISLFMNLLVVIILIKSTNKNIEYYVRVILFLTILSSTFQIIYAKRLNFNYTPNLQLNSKEFIGMGRIFMPIALSTGVYHISLMVDTMISSQLGAGQISILSYSNNIISMLNGIILSNIMIYLYPKITLIMKDKKSFYKIEKIISSVSLFTFFILGSFLSVGYECITLLYERGNFTSSDTVIVFFCILIYMISFPLNAARDLIYKCFYAQDQTIIPFINSLLTSFLNIIISIVLSKLIGIYGVILGTTLTTVIGTIIINKKFTKYYEFKIINKNFVNDNFKFILSIIISFIILNYFKTIFVFNNLIIKIAICELVFIVLSCIILILIKWLNTRIGS